MVILKTSEYRHAFRPKLEIYTPIYESNYDFRMTKRKTESSHDSNPFSWEPNDEDLDNELRSGSSRPPSVPFHIYKHELINKAYKEKLSPTKRPTPVSCESQKSIEKPPEISKEELKIEIPEENEQDSNDKSEKSMEIATSNEDEKRQLEKHTPSCQMVSLKVQRPKNPTSKAPIPKQRPASSCSERPLKKKNPAIQEDIVKPPFVAYGSWDQEKETAVKKTHNIKASCQIYPAALRAQQRRKYEIERKKKQEGTEQRVRRRNLFNDQMTRETAAWDTEYRQHYIAFDQAAYRASLSARCHPVY